VALDAAVAAAAAARAEELAVTAVKAGNKRYKNL
jgi:hypothetical protein